MDGKTHFVVGGIAGIGVASYIGAELPTAISFTLLGACIGLVPDLDVKGILSNKISLNKNWIVTLLGLLGLLIIVNSFIVYKEVDRWLGAGLGLALIILPPFLIKQKYMLLLTGIATSLIGMSQQSTWLMMLGVYISIAALLPHRSLTHSLIGLFYFSLIGYYLEKDFQINGILLVCVLSYASHLLLDMKIFPKNRKGVKLLQPFSKIEI
ncbi:metal-dependent hydrolase [Lederbergia wuyishanensis]|uniref:Inner membrane protein n=1 Tax=Lederbergia wuyishanensis TaxID=1347903 RepID=A0ABU0D080_9BACI|nr:metal-dependent hydrolase [Lederbergia wuyishanensis]MCJ8006427.1 metal-dependent hydrolase [Lederbergia wuyishanensis]MDQ0341802.1 inner membrane protein [Lederbergia wuyishanensis]